MKINFLGTGGAFEPQYYNSAALLNFRDHTLLIDAGFTVYSRLMELNLIHSFDYILITHLHNDHCGSLANIVLHRQFFSNGKKPIILYQTESFKEEIRTFLTIQLKDPEKYVDFAPIHSLEGISFLDTFGRHSENFQTYSFIFEEGIERLVYSGDLGEAAFLIDHLKTLPHLPTTVFHDITFNPENKGHAHYTCLKPFQNKYNIYGYHCNPEENPADNSIPLVYNQPELSY